MADICNFEVVAIDNTWPGSGQYAGKFYWEMKVQDAELGEKRNVYMQSRSEDKYKVGMTFQATHTGYDPRENNGVRYEKFSPHSDFQGGGGGGQQQGQGGQARTSSPPATGKTQLTPGDANDTMASLTMEQFKTLLARMANLTSLEIELLPKMESGKPYTPTVPAIWEQACLNARTLFIAGNYIIKSE